MLMGWLMEAKMLHEELLSSSVTSATKHNCSDFDFSLFFFLLKLHKKMPLILQMVYLYSYQK